MRVHVPFPRSRRWRRVISAGASLLLLAGCRDREPDAHGNFEAEEVVVSTEIGGQLVAFTPREGDALAAGAAVALVDTVPLALQKRELMAQRAAVRSRAREVESQGALLESQRRIAEREYERTRRLVAAQAATRQQLDRAERDLRTLVDQIQATRVTRSTAGDEVAAIEARIASLDDRIRRARVVNPVAGTVLATFANPGELLQPGQPLYRIAALDTLTLRAYVAGAQLTAVRLGAEVQVRVDDSDTLMSVPGRVTWVASRAEFTPTPVQTKEERTSQVYAVKIAVPNPRGAIKIGMPGELVLPERSATAAGAKP